MADCHPQIVKGQYHHSDVGTEELLSDPAKFGALMGEVLSQNLMTFLSVAGRGFGALARAVLFLE